MWLAHTFSGYFIFCIWGTVNNSTLAIKRELINFLCDRYITLLVLS